MVEMYPLDLKLAAKRLLESEDFQLCVNNHTDNLKQAILDATDDKDILKAHSEYNSIRDFVEYLRMIQAKPKNQQETQHYGA